MRLLNGQCGQLRVESLAAILVSLKKVGRRSSNAPPLMPQMVQIINKSKDGALGERRPTLLFGLIEPLYFPGQPGAGVSPIPARRPF
jgi:hypothetical protein